MQELQQHLDRLTRDKMALEAKIVELSSYQNEVGILRNEITKLQVTFYFFFSTLYKYACTILKTSQLAEL